MVPGVVFLLRLLIHAASQAAFFFHPWGDGDERFFAFLLASSA